MFTEVTVSFKKKRVDGSTENKTINFESTKAANAWIEDVNKIDRGLTLSDFEVMPRRG